MNGFLYTHYNSGICLKKKKVHRMMTYIFCFCSNMIIHFWEVWYQNLNNLENILLEFIVLKIDTIIRLISPQLHTTNLHIWCQLCRNKKSRVIDIDLLLAIQIKMAFTFTVRRQHNFNCYKTFFLSLNPDNHTNILVFYTSEFSSTLL